MKNITLPKLTPILYQRIVCFNLLLFAFICFFLLLFALVCTNLHFMLKIKMTDTKPAINLFYQVPHTANRIAVLTSPSTSISRNDGIT